MAVHSGKYVHDLVQGFQSSNPMPAESFLHVYTQSFLHVHSAVQDST